MNAEDLQEFLSTKLASFKIPVVIKFSDNSLPRLASGKFDKPLLRQLFEKTS
jgi:acyl-CoA synthetase (AMP-forming)/AMP-acid ligase II